MPSFPHSYRVFASGREEGSVNAGSEGLPTLETNPPPAFNGPEGYWSPETLLVASAADCFIFTFRAVARASQLEWRDLRCDVEGVLDKDGKATRFTRLIIRPALTLADEAQREKAERCLEKAERNCLITNSLKTDNELVPEITVA